MRNLTETETGTVTGVPMDEPLSTEQLWSVDQVAEYLRLAPKTLYSWRCRRIGPPSYRLGNKVRYRPDEVRAWVDKCIAAL